jgi:hypothetical protein
MRKKETGSIYTWFVMTIIAWLSLAGLSDGIVDWRIWFEQGVMQHWRSVKEWVIAVLLWWVPFRVPSWLIDYFVLASLVIRTSPMPKWNENWRVGPAEIVEEFGYIPFIWKMEWAISHLFQRWPGVILVFIIWPVCLLFLLIEAIRGKAFAPEVETPPNQMRGRMFGWLSRILWCFISFVPVLFVVSTVLYEHG